MNEFGRARGCTTTKIKFFYQSDFETYSINQNDQEKSNSPVKYFLPRLAASTATPQPVAPPPITTISYSGSCAILSICCSRVGYSSSQTSGRCRAGPAALSLFLYRFAQYFQMSFIERKIQFTSSRYRPRKPVPTADVQRRRPCRMKRRLKTRGIF